MRCDYCIATDMPGPAMSIETGRKAIDMFMCLAEGGKTVEFMFSGGEPLTAFSVFKELTDYAQKCASKVGI